jgi:Arc/MetJ-type ribon-helix-helix transcriptional regulator
VAAPGAACPAAQDAAPAPAPAPIPADSTSGSGSNSSTRGSSSTSSSISFKKDGKLVSIEENGSGITVTVDGKSVQARNVDELKQQHPDAYQLYVEKPGFAVGSAGGSASGSGSRSSSSTKGSRPGSLEDGSSASDLMREKLKELQRERPDDPRLQSIIERMLQEADSAGAAQDAAPASAPSTVDSTSGSGSNSSTRGSSSTSSSISFKKDGKAISIQENGAGIAVTVDGKSVQARNVDELKQEHPDAYKLYVERPGFARGSAGGSARASGSQSSSSTKGSQPRGLETNSSRSRDRSVTVIDGGKMVTIAESASGITVTVGEEIIRAKDADELKKKSAEAFRLYEKHLNKPAARKGGADAEDLLRGKLEEGPSASDLLREKLDEMRTETSDDPRLQGLIDALLKELDRLNAQRSAKASPSPSPIPSLPLPGQFPSMFFLDPVVSSWL